MFPRLKKKICANVQIMQASASCQEKYHYRPVILKVGGIAPLGAILNGKWAKKSKGSIGGETTQRGSKILNH